MSEFQKTSKGKKIFKGVFAAVGIGGIIAIINFFISQSDRLDKKYDEDLDKYYTELNKWNNWFPEPVSTGEDFVEGAVGFDLDKGDKHTNFNMPQMDFYFAPGDSKFNAYLKALHNTKWYSRGKIDIKDISYQDLKNANYEAKRHPNSNSFDIFNVDPFDLPSKGYIYFLKTSDGNLSILQIKEFKQKRLPNNTFTRDMHFWYQTFPDTTFPSKPKPPIKSSGFFSWIGF